MRGINYAKKFFIAVFVYICIFLLTGCCTCRGNTKSDIADAIARNSYAAGKLEATVKALDGTVSDSRERIANIIKTSRGIADGIERIEYLFGKYESEVKRLLSEIDRIRIEAENTGENNNVGSSTSNFRGDSPGDSFSAEN